MFGSPAIPVWLVPDAQLARNGGDIQILGQPAVPISNPPVNWFISTDSNNLLTVGSDGKLFVGLPYKVYVATLTQTGTAAPVATILQNTLGGTVTWSRVSAGIYLGTLTGAFTAGKVWVTVQSTQETPLADIFGIRPDTVNRVSLSHGPIGGTPEDEFDSLVCVELRIYP